MLISSILNTASKVIRTVSKWDLSKIFSLFSLLRHPGVQHLISLGALQLTFQLADKKKNYPISNLSQLTLAWGTQLTLKVILEKSPPDDNTKICVSSTRFNHTLTIQYHSSPAIMLQLATSETRVMTVLTQRFCHKLLSKTEKKK